jgi:hypothetical protein
MPKSRPILSVRAAAVADLIAAHTDEFHGYMAKHAADSGVEWAAPVDKTEVRRKRAAVKAGKARTKIEALLAENPALRNEYGPASSSPEFNEPTF